MSRAEKPLTELVQQLPPDIARDVRHYIEFFLERQRQAAISPVDRAARGWPVGFFAATAGSMPDFPEVERDHDGIDPRMDDVVQFDDQQDNRLAG